MIRIKPGDSFNMSGNPPPPLVSVIVPVYNCERYVGACVQSVLSQTIADWEVILVDDGSQRDNTPAIVDQLAKSDPRIRAVHQQNGGTSAARNAGFNLISAASKFILFLDCDDLIAPEMLAVMSDALHTHPEWVAISCEDNIIDENDSLHCDDAILDRRSRRALASKSAGIRTLMPTERDTSLSLLTWNGIRTPGCVLIRRSVYDDAKLSFRTDLLQCADWEMWLRLCRIGPIARRDQKLLHYRRHSGNISGNIKQMQAEVRKVRREVLASPDYTVEEKHACRVGFRAFEKDAMRDKLRLIRDDTKRLGVAQGLGHAKYLIKHTFRYLIGRP
jgi:glycosyltransferase involved in cell wall biosynthesis